MKIDELKKDEFIIEWLDTVAARKASKNTVSNYLFGMQFYTDCLQKTPSELIQEATDEYLIKFVKHLKEKKLAPMTIRTYFNGVKSFHNYYGIELPSLVKKIDELKKDDFIIDWLDTLEANEASDKTIRNYLLGMQAYTDCVKKTPTELILEAEAEIKAGLLGRERNLKRNLVKFLKHLQEKELAPMTVRTHMAGIKSFYKNSDISFPASLPKIGSKAVTLEENKPIPSKDDLRTVLKICDNLERALVLVGVSSGLGCEDIIKLKVGQFKNNYDSKTGITTLILRRTKTKVDFITFLSPEASQEVWDYLEYRERTSIDDRQQQVFEKQHVYSDNDYLFIGRRIPDSFLETRDDNERRLQEKALVQIYSNISKNARKCTAKGQWNLIRSHKMRAFFNTALKTAGADSFHVEFWMGHKLDGSKASYFLGDPEGERELYSQYVPFLTIKKEANVSESPEFQKLLKQNKILARETAKHVVENSELQEVNVKLEEATKQIAEMKDDYQSLMADKDLASTVSKHYNDEAVRKGIAEFLLLSQSQERMKKKMKEPLVDTGSEVDFMEE